MRIAVAGGASLVALALLAYALRGPLIAAVTAPLLSLLTGYHVRYDSLAVGHGVIAATGVTVDRGSEPILSAPRIDATYALRDIFPGGSHRFGFLSVALERPHVTLVRPFERDADRPPRKDVAQRIGRIDARRAEDRLAPAFDRHFFSGDRAVPHREAVVYRTW